MIRIVQAADRHTGKHQPHGWGNDPIYEGFKKKKIDIKITKRCSADVIMSVCLCSKIIWNRIQTHAVTHWGRGSCMWKQWVQTRHWSMRRSRQWRRWRRRWWEGCWTECNWETKACCQPGHVTADSYEGCSSACPTSAGCWWTRCLCRRSSARLPCASEGASAEPDRANGQTNTPEVWSEGDSCDCSDGQQPLAPQTM